MTGRFRGLAAQFARFGLVGVVATGIDFVTLALLTECLGTDPVLSAGISFTVSVVFNYVASMRYVFTRRNDLTRSRELAIFVLLSIIGLGINELLMWAGVHLLEVNYILVKLLATAIVMLWNFFSRKRWLEARN